MKWRRPTLDDLRGELSDQEIARYTSAATKDVTYTPIEVIISNVAELVRGYIQSAPRAVILPADTQLLPECLIAPAMDYAMGEVLKKIALEINETRREAIKRAVKLFERVMDGDFKIRAEDAPQESTSPVAVGLAVRSRPRYNSGNVEVFP